MMEENNYYLKGQKICKKDILKITEIEVMINKIRKDQYKMLTRSENEKNSGPKERDRQQDAE